MSCVQSGCVSRTFSWRKGLLDGRSEWSELCGRGGQFTCRCLLDRRRVSDGSSPSHVPRWVPMPHFAFRRLISSACGTPQIFHLAARVKQAEFVSPGPAKGDWSSLESSARSFCCSSRADQSLLGTWMSFGLGRWRNPTCTGRFWRQRWFSRPSSLCCLHCYWGQACGWPTSFDQRLFSKRFFWVNRGRGLRLIRFAKFGRWLYPRYGQQAFLDRRGCRLGPRRNI